MNVCFHAGLPRSLYIRCECVFLCWTPTKLVYLLAWMCFHAELTELYIPLCECVFPCWTPTELVYPLVWMCVSMLDSNRACISSCLNVAELVHCISSCVNVCFHAGLPQSFYILLCECVFPCWTPTELLYPLVWMCVSMLDSHRATISSCVNVCFHAGLQQSL